MKKTTEQKLLNKINKVNGCWEWTASADKDGYGYLRINNKKPKAHRLAYETWIGPIPEDKPQVLHHCDNPPCINPEHLYAGTNKDNVKDRIKRNRSSRYWSTITHCKYGHEFNEINTRYENGERACRPCGRRRSALYKTKAVARQRRIDALLQQGYSPELITKGGRLRKPSSPTHDDQS